MVARITSGATPAGALHYNKSKIDRSEASFLACCNTPLQMPQDGHFDIREAMQCFEPYLRANKRTKMPVFHVSLNPAPEDRLTDAELRQIAQEYMEGMGYGEQPYFIFKHEDIDRSHLHIVSLRIGLDGRKLPHDFEARRSMALLRELEDKYHLRPALKGEDEQQAFHPIRKVRYREGNIKQQISSQVRSMLHGYLCPSFGELRTLLEGLNVSIEEQRGTIRDRDYAGILYGALDDRGERVGVPIKASRIGRDVGFKAMERYYDCSKKKLHDDPTLLDHTRQAILQAREATHVLPEFQRLLETEGITAVIRHTDTGRIYGTTFIDHQTGVVVNGSRLGREFAANSFEEHFRSTDTIEEPLEHVQEQQVVQEREQQVEPEYREQKHRSQTGDSFSALFDVFDGTAPYKDPIIREKKRKKKRRKKL